MKAGGMMSSDELTKEQAQELIKEQTPAKHLPKMRSKTKSVLMQMMIEAAKKGTGVKLFSLGRLPNKYITPHQGAREKARRAKRMQTL